VIAPPAACYGLATIRDNQAPVTTALFATAPMPTMIDFPNLKGDLIAGHVRRRGLFLWPLALSGTSQDLAAFLLKYDRQGGGQVPNTRQDFIKPRGKQ
jgi:hypothetical protein